MSSIAQAYDRWSHSYDSDRNATRDLDAIVLRAANLAVRDAEVVEIGCGTGKNTQWLAEHARSVLAMDFSTGMMRKARALVPASHVRFVQHDVRDAWPVPDASVDVVVGNLVLEHVELLSPVFAEAARVLRPGGTLYICELHPFRQWKGGQAHFADAQSGDIVHVPAFVHTVAEFVNSGIEAGLVLSVLGEHVEEGAEHGALPRLLTVTFRRP